MWEIRSCSRWRRHMVRWYCSLAEELLTAVVTEMFTIIHWLCIWRIKTEQCIYTMGEVWVLFTVLKHLISLCRRMLDYAFLIIFGFALFHWSVIQCSKYLWWILGCSIRQCALTIHEDLTPDQLFTGEPARLHSLKSQKPLVLYIGWLYLFI